MDITFADKEYLWALLLLLPLIGWYIWRNKKQHAHLTIPSILPFGRFVKTSNIRQHALFAMLCGAVTSLIIAISRPQTTLSFEKTKTKGIDIVISLDISYSMLAQDFTPDRLEAAKKVGIEFVTNRPNDRMGLVLFSGESYTQCPLTADQTVLINLFSQVKNNNAISSGTAIGNGLATAINRLRKSDAKSKIIILITDGENNRGSIHPETAAELAEKLGIKVYTIGIGSNGTARTPIPTSNGMIQYIDVPVKIDEPLLRKIAKITHGRYFRATSNTKLKEIYAEIDTLEKTEIKKDKHTQYNEIYMFFAFIAFGLLSLYLFLKLVIFRTTL